MMLDAGLVRRCFPSRDRHRRKLSCGSLAREPQQGRAPSHPPGHPLTLAHEIRPREQKPFVSFTAVITSGLECPTIKDGRFHPCNCPSSAQAPTASSIPAGQRTRSSRWTWSGPELRRDRPSTGHQKSYLQGKLKSPSLVNPLYLSPSLVIGG